MLTGGACESWRPHEAAKRCQKQHGRPGESKDSTTYCMLNHNSRSSNMAVPPLTLELQWVKKHGSITITIASHHYVKGGRDLDMT